MIELVRKQAFQADDVISIEADVTQITFDFTGGGLCGSDREKVTTKEQADHSLPYLLAVALLDGAVMPAQFLPDRINRADVQRLLASCLLESQSGTVIGTRQMLVAVGKQSAQPHPAESRSETRSTRSRQELCLFVEPAAGLAPSSRSLFAQRASDGGSLGCLQRSTPVARQLTMYFGRDVACSRA